MSIFIIIFDSVVAHTMNIYTELTTKILQLIIDLSLLSSLLSFYTGKQQVHAC